MPAPTLPTNSIARDEHRFLTGPTTRWQPQRWR